jgi:hypothetical protein
MVNYSKMCAAGLFLLCLIPVTFADKGTMYEVTITNLTGGQILSPPVVVSHDAGISLFELGQPASVGLAALAEDADNGGLVSSLRASDSVFDVNEGLGGIMPGQSATVTIEVSGTKRLISFASMLVTTNDTFASARGLQAHPTRTVSVVVPGYDAGSEGNNEQCIYIPGPPCENPFQRDVAGAEGFVHVNPGVQGIADLTGRQDWRNPVAQVTVKRAESLPPAHGRRRNNKP